MLPVYVMSSSEVYHGRMWHNDPRFKTHMAEVNGFHVYVGDMIEFIHPQHGVLLGKLLKFYQKVILHMFIIIKMNC